MTRSTRISINDKCKGLIDQLESCPSEELTGIMFLFVVSCRQVDMQYLRNQSCDVQHHGRQAKNALIGTTWLLKTQTSAHFYPRISFKFVNLKKSLAMIHLRSATRLRGASLGLMDNAKDNVILLLDDLAK